MKYFKLLLLNLIVASVIAMSFVGFVKADGLDDPSFYHTPTKRRTYGDTFDFCMSSKFNNQNRQCRQYDDMGAFNWPSEIVDIPTQSVVVPVPTNIDVPEPEQVLLLGLGLLALWFYKL